MHIEIQNCFSFWGTSSPRPPTGASPLDPTGGPLSPRPPAQDVPTHFVPGLRPDYNKNYEYRFKFPQVIGELNRQQFFFWDTTCVYTCVWRRWGRWRGRRKQGWGRCREAEGSVTRRLHHALSDALLESALRFRAAHWSAYVISSL